VYYKFDPGVSVWTLAPVLTTTMGDKSIAIMAIALSSFVVDWVTRKRLTGTHMTLNVPGGNSDTVSIRNNSWPLQIRHLFVDYRTASLPRNDLPQTIIGRPHQHGNR
jgi:hypothetical protein